MPNGQVERVPERGTVTIAGARHICFTDADVPVDDRQAVETVALTFVRTLLGPSPMEAYAMMAPEAWTATSPEAFATIIRALTKIDVSSRDAALEHTHLVENSGERVAERAVCGLLKNHQSVSVAVLPGPKQAYVVISNKNADTRWCITIMLVPEAGRWSVGAFHVGMAIVAGRSPDDVLQLARRERDDGHLFNAVALYALLGRLIDRGPNFQMAIGQDLAKDLAARRIPPEIRGSPPFTWRLSGKEYTVEHISVSGVQRRGQPMNPETGVIPHARDGRNDHEKRMVDPFLPVRKG